MSEQGSWQSQSLCNLLVAAFLALTAGCKKDVIIDHFGGGLTVTPLRLLDSATAGDITVRDMVLHTVNQGGGELRWRAMLKQPADWLSIHPDSGLAGIDSIVASANPTGLAVGVYSDTIIIVPSTGIGAGQVPVELRIRSQ
jgi:hypothetical protein